MTSITHAPFDPLTGLPVIRLIHAVNRVLGTTGNNVYGPAMLEELRDAVPVVEIAGVEFFSWREFVAFLDRMTTEREEDAL